MAIGSQVLSPSQEDHGVPPGPHLGSLAPLSTNPVIKGTVNAALDEVIALNRRRRLLERLVEQRGVDLSDEEIMREAWK